MQSHDDHELRLGPAELLTPARRGPTVSLVGDDVVIDLRDDSHLTFLRAQDQAEADVEATTRRLNPAHLRLAALITAVIAAAALVTTRVSEPIATPDLVAASVTTTNAIGDSVAIPPPVDILDSGSGSSRTGNASPGTPVTVAAAVRVLNRDDVPWTVVRARLVGDAVARGGTNLGLPLEVAAGDAEVMPLEVDLRCPLPRGSGAGRLSLVMTARGADGRDVDVAVNLADRTAVQVDQALAAHCG